MNTSRTSIIATTAAVAVLATALTACNSNPSRATACSLPEGPDLDRAISAARFDLETGCEQQFDQYFQRLLTIAEGDPKKDNKAAFSEFLIWANEEGLLSKRQARETYTRYFGVKYVSLISDYSVCDQTCPRQDEIMREMNKELVDKEQGLLKVSADKREYYRANRLFQETELVLEATCEACGPIE
ncbi:hypothetical protein ACFL3A_11530 [Pseudomonadota bacterium]